MQDLCAAVVQRVYGVLSVFLRPVFRLQRLRHRRCRRGLRGAAGDRQQTQRQTRLRRGRLRRFRHHQRKPDQLHLRDRYVL